MEPAYTKLDRQSKPHAAFFARLSLCESTEGRHFRGAKGDTYFPHDSNLHPAIRPIAQFNDDRSIEAQIRQKLSTSLIIY